MKEEREPHEERSASSQLLDEDALTPSLTDLIDEMDRAAFRRSLAGRNVGKPLEIEAHDLQTQPKS